MEELIWFSFPGAILTITLIVFFPKLLFSQTTVVLLLASAPIFGYIVQEFYRLLFDIFNGYDSKSRIVLNEIIKLSPKDNKINRKEAFLVWEATIYSDKFPDSLRTHYKQLWHYMFSFDAMATASIISILIITIFKISSRGFEIVIPFLLIGGIFLWKKSTTYKSLNEQEVFAFYKFTKQFQDNLDILYKERGLF
jgi:hypothetical protein